MTPLFVLDLINLWTETPQSRSTGLLGMSLVCCILLKTCNYMHMFEQLVHNRAVISCFVSRGLPMTPGHAICPGHYWFRPTVT